MRGKWLACWLIFLSPSLFAAAPVVDLSAPKEIVKKTQQINQLFKKSVLETFSVLSNEIKERQRDGNDLLGRSRIERDHEIAAAPKKAVFTVVIDPGHGGRDTGAVGPQGQYEKNVALAIAKQLATLINQQPGMHAVLTRNGDYFVPLRKRLKLARKGDADLFMAIHADGSRSQSAHGASVFALSMRGATSEAARWLADRENHSALDDIQLNNLSDNSLMVRSVLIDLAQSVTIRDSVKLATRLLDQLNDVTTLHYKRVEQAPFVVLKSPDIPSVLIETGFISNPREVQLLTSNAYQKKMARAILQGILSYRSTISA